MSERCGAREPVSGAELCTDPNDIAALLADLRASGGVASPRLLLRLRPEIADGIAELIQDERGLQTGGPALPPEAPSARVDERRPASKLAPGEGVHPSGKVGKVEKLPGAGSGCTLKAYAVGTGLPLDYLRSLGLSELGFEGRSAVRIPYLGVDGRECGAHFCVAPPQERQFRAKRRAKPQPYGLWRLAEAQRAGCVVIVAAETDAQALWCAGIPALAVPGAESWDERWADYFDGIENVLVVVGPLDGEGRATVGWLGRSRLRQRARLVHLPGDVNVAALYAHDPAAFADVWRSAVEAAPEWEELMSIVSSQIADEAWEHCRGLACEPNILARLVEVLARRGFIGQEREAKLLYLAMTSRVLERPVSIAVKGVSSAGKSFLVQSVLDFFPPNAAYALTSMSPKALAYGDVPLTHRMLVLYEACGIQSDITDYMLRSLLSEGRVRYETVEKGDDGQLRVRLIDRAGPTGLITTTTAISLHPENETRLLSIGVDESPAQTRRVMLAMVSDDAEDEASDDLGDWLALQRLIEASPNRVVIPYGQRLAELIPPVATRMRRDFRTVLSLIRAHALLHQATRHRDADGRIIATVADYAAVRELLGQLIAEGTETLVPADVRAVVEAVEQLAGNGAALVDGGATLQQVADALHLDLKVARRRLQAAEQRGFVCNLEPGQGRQAGFVVGADPLPPPSDGAVLPPSDLLSHFPNFPQGVGTPLKGQPCRGQVGSLEPGDESEAA